MRRDPRAYASLKDDEVWRAIAESLLPLQHALDALIANPLRSCPLMTHSSRFYVAGHTNILTRTHAELALLDGTLMRDSSTDTNSASAYAADAAVIA